MSSSGVILLNLENRNAAEFQLIEVPGSYDKALGAATAGSYITVYKWLYNGFAMTASLCTAEDKTDYISLVDKTNGGELKVYPDDTITLVGSVSPTPEPSYGQLHATEDGTYLPSQFGLDAFDRVDVDVLNHTYFPCYHIYSGSIVEPYSLMVQKGYFTSEKGDPADMTLIGSPIEVTMSMALGGYFIPGVLMIDYSSGWLLKATNVMDVWADYEGITPGWTPVPTNTILEQLDRNVYWSGAYYCQHEGGTST